MSDKKEPKILFTYKLQFPIEWGDEGTVEELEFVEPKGKHMRNIKGGTEAAQGLEMIQQLCGRPRTFVDELDVRDINKISEKLAGFLESGLAT